MAKPKKEKAGYGNIYTPHAGSMIIQVQRESGLANRTIVLTPRQVKLLRWLFSRRGILVAGAVLVSWIFFAIQAARVPVLTSRLEEMHYQSTRLDTLQLALDELQKRYAQVQTMLSSPGANAATAAAASTAPGATAAGAAGARNIAATSQPTAAAAASPAPATSGAARATAVPAEESGPPSRWPLPVAGYVTRGTLGEGPYNGPHPGIDIAVPEGTEIRAAGGGSVVEVGENEDYGKFLRVAHADGYETLYAHASRVLVVQGQRVTAGEVLARSGNTGRSTAPHLHFEVRRAGEAVDPLKLIKQGQ